jgi:hypothetical protein
MRVYTSMEVVAEEAKEEEEEEERPPYALTHWCLNRRTLSTTEHILLQNTRRLPCKRCLQALKT